MYFHLAKTFSQSFPSRFRSGKKRAESQGAAGMTLLELLVACSILMLLATMALPMARMVIREHKESELRYDLREMRDAIDRYKDAADKNLIQTQAGTENYPPDLETLVTGVTMNQVKDRKIRFLRSIPVDPMTGQKDWGLRSVQDDPDATAWGGTDVFDVYSKSTGTALDGTKYSDW
jgi:general secretion pathway protein G